METMLFEYPATKKLAHKAHVGVVGSGDLEVLVTPSDEPWTRVEVRTGMTGFDDTWKRVIERFFNVHAAQATIKVNDFGATPGVVSLRLAQALEVSEQYERS
ncbi:malonate decarboxylase subunit delta [Halobacillus amylolyticus]|uniref:Malonate decarboxylase acyl carrier protein n=1 Tax=Halobacillus amylolyticus TaxID=2932259 RepID=A0ABY4HFZ0_9BACI|nr:malonate decarboxylase subunit delta [Halobacillus amylolyticus]UOR13577.1 malonate decarboxylase subunit delta [Halobacillus amylolyticus]